MYGVSVKMTGTGSFCPWGRNAVAFRETPSRMGIFTAYFMSTSAALLSFSCAQPFDPARQPNNANANAKRHTHFRNIRFTCLLSFGGNFVSQIGQRCL